MTAGKTAAYHAAAAGPRRTPPIDKRIKLLLILGIAAILGTDVVGFIRFAAPWRIRLHNPVAGFDHPLDFVAAGDAWTPSGLPPVSVRARHLDSGMTLVFEAAQDAVKYRGRVVRELAAFSAPLRLPVPGRWEITALMHGSGAEISTVPRVVTVRPDAPARLFTAFGGSHIAVLAVLAALFLLLVVRYRKARSGKEVHAVSLAVTVVLFTNEIVYHVYWVAIDAWSPGSTVMLHMCSFAVFVLPFLMFMKPGAVRQRLFEVMYFFCLGGALQACLAPDIGPHSFPEIRFFTYFTAHGLLVLGAVLLALTSGMPMTFGSYLRGAAVSLAATAAAYGVDQLFRFLPPYEPSNFFLMGYPPPTGSVVDVFADVFGPSPAYGIGLVLMGLVLFAAVYLPYPILRWWNRRRA